jgi:hypothetical protein
MGKLHDGQVARHLERELEAFLAFGLCGGLGRLHHVVGHALQFAGAGVVAPGVGGVQRVFAEFLAQLGLAFLNPGKTLRWLHPADSAPDSTKLRMAFLGLALFGVQGAGSIALYLAYRRSSAPRRVQNSVTRGKASL